MIGNRTRKQEKLKEKINIAQTAVDEAFRVSMVAHKKSLTDPVHYIDEYIKAREACISALVDLRLVKCGI
jgi:hypothetical protein